MNRFDVADVEIENLKRFQVRQRGQKRQLFAFPSLRLIQFKFDDLVTYQITDQLIGPVGIEHGSTTVLPVFQGNDATCTPRGLLPIGARGLLWPVRWGFGCSPGFQRRLARVFAFVPRPRAQSCRPAPRSSLRFRHRLGGACQNPNAAGYDLECCQIAPRMAFLRPPGARKSLL
jgi:hypothetical protein